MQLRWVLLVYAAWSDPAGQGEISILKSAVVWTSCVYNVDLANTRRQEHLATYSLPLRISHDFRQSCEPS